MSPARAQTHTTRSGDERTNHEANIPSLHPGGGGGGGSGNTASHFKLQKSKINEPPDEPLGLYALDGLLQHR